MTSLNNYNNSGARKRARLDLDFSEVLPNSLPVFGRTAAADFFLSMSVDFRCFDDIDIHDVFGLGSYYELHSSYWSYQEKLGIVYSSHDGISVQTVCVDENHIVTETGQPQRLTTLQRPVRCDLSWLADFLNASADGTELQNVGDVPMLFADLQSSIMGLFSTNRLGSIPDPETAQSAEDSFRALKESGFTVLSAFRWTVANWRSLRDSPICGHMSNLLGIAIALGFAPAEWSEIHVNSIKVWRLTTAQRYQDLSSIIDGTLMGVNYFVESVIASWEQKSLLPFLYEKSTSAHLDSIYEGVSNRMPEVRSGTVPEDFCWSSLYLEVERAVRIYKNAVEVAPGGSLQRKIFQDRYCRLKEWLFELCSMRKNGNIVEQAFSAVISGDPGCGKSSVTLDLQKIRSAQLGVKYDPSLTARIEPGDAYHSQVFNYTKFLVFDDVANRPIKYDPSLAMAAMLQAVNNTQFVAVKAEVELKGEVMPDLKAVFGTTNNRGLHLSAISTHPDSLRRRFFLVDMIVKSDYRNSLGGLDTDKFDRDPIYTTYCGNRYKAHQLFTINIAHEGGHQPHQMFNPRTGRNRTLELMEIDEFYYFMELLMIKHDKEQKEHVHTTNSRTFSKCEECGRVSCICVLPSIAEEEDSSDDETMTAITEATSYDGSEPVENQNAFSKAIGQAMTKSFEHAIYERMGDLWIIGRIAKYLFPGPAIVERITRELLSFLSTEDYLQWWYYVPEDAWKKWKIFKHMSPVVQDVQLRRLILTWRRAGFLGLLMAGIGLVLHFMGYGWSRTYICIIPGIALWFYSSLRTAKLRLDAFKYLSEKRSKVISAMSEENREQEWSARTKALYAMTQGAFMLTGFATLAYLIHDAFTDSNVETSLPKRLAGMLPTVRKSNEKVGAPAPPSPIPKPNNEISTVVEVSEQESPIELQNFIEVSDESLKKRDETINVWEQKVVNATMGYTNPTMTRQQFVSLAPKNLSAIYEKIENDWVYKTNVYWVDTDVCLLTEHDIPSKTVFWKIVDNEHTSSEHIVTISPEDFLNFKDTGIAIGRIVHRNKKPMVKYLNNTPGQLRASFYHRSSNGFLDDPIKVTGKRVVHSETGVESIVWEWPVDTYAGACGGIYVSDGDRNPAILGIHYGCIVGMKRLGRSFLPSQADVKNALDVFVKKPEVLFAGREPVSWENDVGGKPTFTPSDELVEGGILDQAKWLLENGHAQEVFQGAENKGRIWQNAFYKSRAVKSLIADDISELCPDLEFGKPRFGRSMWPKSAVYSVNPTPGLPTDDLRWAVQDYLKGFEKFPEYLRSTLRPLEWDEVLNGIDGVRFIDSMNWNTSMGKGYSGGKRSWIRIYLDELGQEKKDFLEEVWTDVQNAIEKIDEGRRVPWLFNAVPKDEPTKVDKKKVRLFMVAQISCTLLVRKYFTPVCRVLQMMTGVSECAVGMNATSEDWEYIWQHLEKFKYLFDGDHKKYDLSKSAKISLSSYKIMIEIAAYGHYTAQDLYRMSVIVGDLVRPLANYTGEVILLDGSTPSGIPVTVIINGLDNSLMNRCAFKSCYPDSEVGDFRKYVAHLNFGDDFINAVSWWRRKFNFLFVQKYFLEYGINITPGLKDAEGKKFVKSSAALVFLQRTSSKLPELPFRVGKLNESSIWKPLLCVMESKDNFCPELAAAVNVDGGLREWLYHGEEKYEQRRTQMDGILTKHNIRHLSRVIDKPYRQLLGEMQEIDDNEKA